MTTRSALITRILDDLERDTSWNSRVTNAIDDAIKNWQPKRFYFNESRSVTFNTVDGTDYYTFNGASPDIGTTFYRIDYAEATENSQDYPLEKKSYADLKRWADASSTKNRPYFMAYVDEGLLLYPKPNDAYTITLTGHVKLAGPSSDAEENNSWMVEAFELIRASAKLYLAVHVLEDDNLAARMIAAEKRALKNLNSATTDKAGSGTIQPTCF